MHALIPLTAQEEAVKELLDERGLPYRVHEVFAYKERSIVVDFFLQQKNLVIECCFSKSRSGTALGWMERNGIYVDYKFRRLKEAHPEISCLAFVEAPQVDLERLRERVAAVVPHADWLVLTIAEFELAVREWCGVGGQVLGADY